MNLNNISFQKEQVQLDSWKADLSELNSKALLASADIRFEMNKHIRSISNMLNVYEEMLTSNNKMNKKAFNSNDIGMESALLTLKYSVIDATAKFK